MMIVDRSTSSQCHLVKLHLICGGFSELRTSSFLLAIIMVDILLRCVECAIAPPRLVRRSSLWLRTRGAGKSASSLLNATLHPLRRIKSAFAGGRKEDLMCQCCWSLLCSLTREYSCCIGRLALVAQHSTLASVAKSLTLDVACCWSIGRQQ